jgi:hypothetical protein
MPWEAGRDIFSSYQIINSRPEECFDGCPEIKGYGSGGERTSPGRGHTGSSVVGGFSADAIIVDCGCVGLEALQLHELVEGHLLQLNLPSWHSA